MYLIDHGILSGPATCNKCNSVTTLRLDTRQ